MNYGDNELSFSGMASAGIDQALEGGLGPMGDGESRDKAKVIYICGGKFSSNSTSCRVRQGERL